MHAQANFPDGLSIKPSCIDTSAAPPDKQDDIDKFGIAGRTWEAAYAMHRYLTDTSTAFDPACPSLAGRNIVELGSGTGYLGLSMARSLSKSEKTMLYMTDLDEVCPLLERNLSTVSADLPVRVRPLAWGDARALEALKAEMRGSPDIVLASDLVYFPFLYPPLLRTLINLANTTSTIVITAYKTRSLTREQPFWDAFGAWFDMETVLVREKEGLERFGGSENIYVFVCRRRRETLGRVIPETDEALMRGQGVSAQFETLLFNSMDPYDDDDDDNAPAKHVK